MIQTRYLLVTLIAAGLFAASAALAQETGDLSEAQQSAVTGPGLNARESPEERKAPYTLRMAAGFTGTPDRIRTGRWFPVTVEVRNRTDKESDAVLTLTWFSSAGEATDLSYSRRIVLPPGSRKRARFVVLDRPSCGVLLARLESSGSALATQSNAIYRDHDDRSPVLVVTEKPGRFSFLLPRQVDDEKQEMAPVVRRDVWEESPESMPEEWTALEGCDAIVLDGVPMSAFTVGQRNALREYVLLGGRLVFMYGSGVATLNSPPARDLAALLPVTLTGKTLSLNARLFEARYGGQIQVQGTTGADPAPGKQVPMLVAAAIARSANEKVALDVLGAPIVAWADRGLGRAVFCGFTIAESPFRGWEGRTPLFDELLGWGRLGVLTPTTPPSRSGTNPYVPPTHAHQRPSELLWPQLAEVTNRDAVIKPWPREYAGLFLLAYVIALVPLTYLLFRMVNRTEYAWLLTPITIAGFAIGIQRLGASAGADAVSAQAYTLIEAGEGSPMGRATSLVSLYTPSRGDFDVAFTPSSCWPSPVPGTELSRGLTRRAFTVDESGPPRLSEFEMLPRSTRLLRMEQAVGMGQGVAVDLKLEGTQDWRVLRLTGKIVNGTKWPLTRPVLVFHGKIAARVDALAPGETLSVDESLQIGSRMEALDAEESNESRLLCIGAPIPAIPDAAGPGGLFAQIIHQVIRDWSGPSGTQAALLAQVPPEAVGLSLDGRPVRPEGCSVLYVPAIPVSIECGMDLSQGGFEYRILQARRKQTGVSWTNASGEWSVTGGGTELEIEARAEAAGRPGGKGRFYFELDRNLDGVGQQSRQSALQSAVWLLMKYGWEFTQDQEQAKEAKKWKSDSPADFIQRPSGVVRWRVVIPELKMPANTYYYADQAHITVISRPRLRLCK